MRQQRAGNTMDARRGGATMLPPLSDKNQFCALPDGAGQFPIGAGVGHEYINVLPPAERHEARTVKLRFVRQQQIEPGAAHHGALHLGIGERVHGRPLEVPETAGAKHGDVDADAHESAVRPHADRPQRVAAQHPSRQVDGVLAVGESVGDNDGTGDDDEARTREERAREAGDGAAAVEIHHALVRQECEGFPGERLLLLHVFAYPHFDVAHQILAGNDRAAVRFPQYSLFFPVGDVLADGLHRDAELLCQGVHRHRSVAAQHGEHFVAALFRQHFHAALPPVDNPASTFQKYTRKNKGSQPIKQEKKTDAGRHIRMTDCRTM